MYVERLTPNPAPAIQTNPEVVDAEIINAHKQHMVFLEACQKAMVAFTYCHTFNFNIDGPDVLFFFASPFGKDGVDGAGIKLSALRDLIDHDVPVKTNQLGIQRSDDKTQVLITFAKGIKMRVYSCEVRQFESYFAMMDMCNQTTGFSFHHMEHLTNNKEQQS